MLGLIRLGLNRVPRCVFTLLLSLLIVELSWAQDFPPPGSRGYGLTVYQGTDVSRFSVRALGVSPGILRGKDMLLIEIEDGPVKQWESGIVAGMSGSPIYFDDKLVGALSYGYSGGRLPIAGVTPIASMYELLDSGEKLTSETPLRGALSKPIIMDNNTYDKVLVGHDAPVQSGQLTLTPLTSVLQLDGIEEAAVETLISKLPSLRPVVNTSTLSLKKKHPTPKIEPGSAVGIQLIRGDFSAGLNGTVTWREGNKILAFGHSGTGLGNVELPLSAVYVNAFNPSYSKSTRLSAALGLIGIAVRDDYFGIVGQLERTSPYVPVKIRVREQTYELELARHPLLTSNLLSTALSQACSSEVGRKVPYRLKLEGTIAFRSLKEPIPIHMSVSGEDAPGKLSGFLNYRLEQLLDTGPPAAQIESADFQVTVEPASLSRIVGLKLDKKRYTSGEIARASVSLNDGTGSLRVEEFSVPLPRVEKEETIKISAGGSPIGYTPSSLTDPVPLTLQQRVRFYLQDNVADDSVLLYRNRGYSAPKAPIVAGRPLHELPPAWLKLFSSFGGTTSFWFRRLYIGTNIKFGSSVELEIDVEPPPESPDSEKLISHVVQSSEQTEATHLKDLGENRYRWVVDNDELWGEGELDGVSIQRGVRLGGKLQQVDKVRGQVVTSLLSTPRGVYSGWTGGLIRRFFQGKSETVLQTDSAAVTALMNQSGELLFGLSGPGAIQKKDRHFPLASEYVWDLESLSGKTFAACGQPAHLYQLQDDAKLLWTAPDEHITSLSIVDGELQMTTAPKGLIYRFRKGQAELLTGIGEPVYDHDSESGILATESSLPRSGTKSQDLAAVAVSSSYLGGPRGLFLKDDQGMRMLDSKSIHALENHGNQLYVGGESLSIYSDSDRGLYRSPVLNMGGMSQVENVRWSASGPLELRVRTGNTSIPNESWSPWTSPAENAQGSLLSLPVGRFSQFQAILEDGTLDAVDLTFTRKLAGRFQFETPKPGQRIRDKFDLRWSKQPPGSTLRICYRSSDEWIEWDKKVFDPGQISLQGLPEGKLQFRLEAIQRDKVQATAISAPFYHVKTKPEITLNALGKGAATTSPYAQIVKVEFRPKDGEWQSIRSSDGLFDSSKETFQVSLPEGPWELRCFDETGAEGKSEEIEPES